MCGVDGADLLGSQRRHGEQPNVATIPRHVAADERYCGIGRLAGNHVPFDSVPAVAVTGDPVPAVAVTGDPVPAVAVECSGPRKARAGSPGPGERISL